MNRPPRQRALSLDCLRAFEAVARLLSFSAAAAELHLSQSAVSRQIQGLEAELGATLFNRGTRKVELSADGATLLQSTQALLERLDRTVTDIRRRRGRRQVSLSTFASFATLWLLPRLAVFQQTHPDIDIRISADDRLVDADDPDIDLILRYGLPGVAPPHAERLFGEVVTPVASPRLLEQSRAGGAAPLRTVKDLAAHALLEEDDRRASARYTGWRHWLAQAGLPALEPRRWVYLNYTHQQVQGALAGQGIALARMALVHELIESGELVEPFGPTGRASSPAAYWMAASLSARTRPELLDCMAWVRTQAQRTRSALGEAGADAPGASD